MPTVGSLFSGIGGLDLGLEQAGWEVAFQVEQSEFCNTILERHWPGVARHTDVRAVGAEQLPAVDLLVGGFPCQDLSVAGSRRGLAGDRSGLFREFVRIAGELRPQWLIIENVLGLLTSHEGEDFEVLVEAFSELGYGLSWRTLDSQFHGVPQRRRRVFLVGYLGAPCPSEILFDGEGSDGHPAPVSVQADTGTPAASVGSDVTGTLTPGAHPGSYNGQDAYNNLLVYGPTNNAGDRTWHDIDAARAVNVNSQTNGGTAGLVVGQADDASRMGAVAGVPRWMEPEGTHEPDSPRLRAIGNAVSVPVARLLGERIIAKHRELEAKNA